MRPFLLLFALTFGPVAAHAQSAEAVFDALTALAIGGDDDEDDGGGLCGTGLFGVTESELENGETGFTCTEWAVILGGVTAFIGAWYLWENGACGDTCMTGLSGRDPSHAAPVLWSGSEPGRVLLLDVVETQRRGFGLDGGRAPITIRALDFETRQPVALGPLGGTTATVRTAADLQALLRDR